MNGSRLWRSAPRGPLSAFVDCLWIHESYGGSHPRERVLPTATTDLVFSSHPSSGLASTVAGPRSHCIELDTSQPFSACGVHFKPGGARPFVGVPADELHNEVVGLQAVWGGAAASVEAQLWDATTPEQRLRVVEDALRARMSQSSPNPAVAYAVGMIVRSGGARPVSEITGRIGVSTRRFLDLFRQDVGVSPKTFSRMRRFAAVLAAVDRTIEVDWTDVALACGYFDQAHFNHDFRAFSGVSPSEYLRSRASRTHLIVA